MPQEPHMLIFTERPSQRVAYVFRYILNQRLGCTLSATHQWDEFTRYAGPKISYTCEDKGEGLWLPASSWMFSDRIEPLDLSLKATTYGLLPFVFEDGKGPFPFDVIAATFFFLSRYEEYLPFSPDALSRFPAAASLLYQMNALERPLIDEWIRELTDMLEARFPGLSLQREAYQFQPTYDIDVAYAFLGRPFWRSSGAFLRDMSQGRFALVRQRMNVAGGWIRDPFDHFDLLTEWHQSLHLDPIFFFLLGKRGPRDRNLSPGNPQLRNLIRKLAGRHLVGIHPSFASNDIPGRLAEEKESLERILGNEVKHSRQHYLRLSLPDTYRNLLKAGITDDYSMGFPDYPGFRAATSRPFPFFDLSANEATSLQVHPLALMDGSLRDYLLLTPEEGLSRALRVLENVRKSGGIFTSLWHNTSLSEETGWQGWKEMYHQFISLAAK